MIISTGSEKAFDKTQHPNMTKVLKTVGIKVMYLIILWVGKTRQQSTLH
jgi:hypothetical protein